MIIYWAVIRPSDLFLITVHVSLKQRCRLASVQNTVCIRMFPAKVMIKSLIIVLNYVA